MLKYGIDDIRLLYERYTFHLSNSNKEDPAIITEWLKDYTDIRQTRRNSAIE